METGVALSERLGFVGLGLMGEPMAVNLARAGTPLVVWNRTPGKDVQLRALGAKVAMSPGEVFDDCDMVFAMLADEAAIDAVVGRHSAEFDRRIEGHTFVHMGTTSPEYSAGLDAAVRAAGGRYVEAPVSGSRVPAQHGELVAMLAGERAAVESVRPWLAPMCRQSVVCGAVPNALSMKLAVNSYLITMVVGLAEAVQLARASGLDLQVLATVLDAGPMASNVSTVKLGKLLGGEFSAQASAADVLKNSRLVAASARAAGVASPLLEASRDLYTETVALGHGADDMIAVIRALQARGSNAYGDAESSA
jgi:3-hydroxyisobutyrate dehydrogenase